MRLEFKTKKIDTRNQNSSIYCILKVKLLQNIVLIFHEINMAIRLNNICMNIIRILAVFIFSNHTGGKNYKI